MKRLLFVTYLIFIFVWDLPASSQELLNLKNLKQEYNHKVNVKKSDAKPQIPQITKHEAIKKDKIKIVYISNSNLFIKPHDDDYLQANYRNIWPFLKKIDSEHIDFIAAEPYFYGLDEQGKNILSRKLVSPPSANGQILYKESQLLLQEAIREVLKSLPLEATDMVIFGGNQVYSNDQMDLFFDIALDLQKYQVPFYQVIGKNDIRGTADLSKYQKDNYYLLKTKGTVILVLDNSNGDIVPANIPEEATLQSTWLKNTLDSLSKTNEDILVFSYKMLSKNDIEFFNSYPSLRLKLVAHSGAKIFAAEDNQNLFVHKSNPILMTNSMLSAYPCSYSAITRDSSGRYKIEEMPVGLKGIRELARTRMGK